MEPRMAELVEELGMECEGCGEKFINLFDGTPVCMDCVKARARVAFTRRCKCGRKRNEDPEPHGPSFRRFMSCRRCLGVTRQLS